MQAKSSSIEALKCVDTATIASINCIHSRMWVSVIVFFLVLPLQNEIEPHIQWKSREKRQAHLIVCTMYIKLYNELGRSLNACCLAGSYVDVCNDNHQLSQQIYKQIIPMLLILYDFFARLLFPFAAASYSFFFQYFLWLSVWCSSVSSEQWFLWLANNAAAIHWKSFILCVALFKSSLLLLLLLFMTSFCNEIQFQCVSFCFWPRLIGGFFLKKTMNMSKAIANYD